MKDYCLLYLICWKMSKFFAEGNISDEDNDVNSN